MRKLALIIEDDEDLADIFAEALRGLDIEVENVTDGRKARERLMEGEVPCIYLTCPEKTCWQTSNGTNASPAPGRSSQPPTRAWQRISVSRLILL
jgi:CheY-like chemotaxis protein